MGDMTSAKQSPPGPATVVIGQRLKPGHTAEYRRWQDEVNTAAARFPGYLGTEATGPDDEQGDSTVIYRFDSPEHLNDWLSSTTRDRLIGLGDHLFETSATQQVLVGGSDNSKLATVVVSHPVRPEDEADFLHWHRKLADAERQFPGFVGAELFRPVAGAQQDWTAVYRFASHDDLDRWLTSDVRKNLLLEGDRFRDFQLRKITNSFGSWFSFGDDGAAASTPSWKTALSVLVGLYPTVVLLTLALSELWRGAPLWGSLLVGNILSVALLTWVVMPAVTRALRFWLTPDAYARQPRTDLLGLLVSVAFLVASAGVFWLVTVQLWRLP
jgi:hypothetical protein